MKIRGRMSFRTALAVLLAVATSLVPAAAQQTATSLPMYDVELVIFRHLSEPATQEAWELESSIGQRFAIPEDDASPFESSAPIDAAGTQTFPALTPSKYKLSAIAAALKRSRNYQPIAHIGWTQPGFSRNAAPFLPLETFIPIDRGLTGRVALSRGRYLHLTLDLAYVPPDGSGRFVMRQSRRMRSTELHYIDHPKFGVIAVVTPAG